jgi:UDP-N-acetylmuramoylalanine--D-glutamate ligase
MTEPLKENLQRQLFDLADQQVLVLGLGESGLAMARWLSFVGARVRVADTRAGNAQVDSAHAALLAAVPTAEFIAGALDESLLEGVELVAWSPGLSIEQGPFEAFYRLARGRAIAVVGEIELFAQALAQLAEQAYSPRVVAITGTNGKTTTTALAAHLCNMANIKTRAAGNISPAALDCLREAIESTDLPELWILELSSFQLALTHSLRPDAASILNVSQDHLDWHLTMQSYRDAKQRIYNATTTAVFNRDDAATKPARAGSAVNAVSFGLSAPAAVGDFGMVRESGVDWLAEAVLDEEAPKRRGKDAAPFRIKHLMPADALKLRGAHNQANVLAALALLKAVGVPLARSLHGVRSFEGEPHRCQWICSIGGVDYFDDSKGTNVGATVAALSGMGKTCVLIAGGDGKGQDFSPLAAPVRAHARAVVLIGRDALLLQAALKATGVTLLHANSMEEAVQLACQQARSGDCVLMSPACASFDMFRNYGHRAEVFVAAVRELALDQGVVQ